MLSASFSRAFPSPPGHPAVLQHQTEGRAFGVCWRWVSTSPSSSLDPDNPSFAACFGLIRQNSPTSAIISPIVKVVPIITARSLSTGHDEGEEGVSERVGCNESQVTSSAKTAHIATRWSNCP